MMEKVDTLSDTSDKRVMNVSPKSSKKSSKKKKRKKEKQKQKRKRKRDERRRRHDSSSSSSSDAEASDRSQPKSRRKKAKTEAESWYEKILQTERSKPRVGTVHSTREGKKVSAIDALLRAT